MPTISLRKVIKVLEMFTIVVNDACYYVVLKCSKKDSTRTWEGRNVFSFFLSFFSCSCSMYSTLFTCNVTFTSGRFPISIEVKHYSQCWIQMWLQGSVIMWIFYPHNLDNATTNLYACIWMTVAHLTHIAFFFPTSFNVTQIRLCGIMPLVYTRMLHPTESTYACLYGM